MLPARYTNAIDEAVERSRNGERRVTIANFQEQGNERFIISLAEKSCVTLEAKGNMSRDGSLFCELLVAELSAQTGARNPEVFRSSGGTVYDFVIK